MTTTYRKKLIEVALPLEAINREAAREKAIRHGHPSTLHLWWARRPLAACRAVLFGQLVDDPSAWPERFPTEETQDKERQRLHRLIERLVPWEASTDENILNEARWEIARSVAWNIDEEPPAKSSPKAVLDYLQTKAPPVYDPFCGGGSIPLEAQRLGLRAYGSDLNPVAVLISKALVEIPPKFAGRPPVNPKSRAELARGGRWNGKGAQGLAEDVRYYGQWMRDEAFKRIGHLYPDLTLPDGRTATVIAWLWARTVASPNPAAKGAHVPLVSSFMLSTKEGRMVWMEIVQDLAAPDGWRFEVKSGALSKAAEEAAKKGTKASRGSNFTCALTATPISPDYIKAEGKAGRMKARLMAIVAEGDRTRIYLKPSDYHQKIAEGAKPEWLPEGALPVNPRWFSPPDYGMPEYKDLFTSRQLVALTTFSDLVNEARDRGLADARTAGLPESPRLADGGTGAEAYADSVATYLALNVSRLANRQATLTFWDPGGQKIQQVFARQALPMVWDYCEGNPFSDSSGNFVGQLEYLTRVIEASPSGTAAGSVRQANAAQLDTFATPWLISTDPPYYDNIGYADLSDFFYIWLRKAARPMFPGLFGTVLVPKAEELVATPYRHGGRDEAEAFFMNGMKIVMKKLSSSVPGSPIPIFYAFRQSEAGQDGVTSKGWATFLQAIVDSGLSIDGTWPMRTELFGNLKKKVNALASSIVLVCRLRPSDAKAVARTDFLRELKRELPKSLVLLQQSSIAPVDLAQASIGPGMAIFSRHSTVLEADDSPMTVKTALQLINAALDEYLSEQEAEYEAHTRFAISLFEQFGFEKAPFGQAQVLATARAVGIDGVSQSGLTEARAGSVRLLRREELDPDWSPEGDSTPTVWECTHHLIRTLLDGGGEAAAADLLRRLGARSEPTRDLAYRLYGICERKKRAEDAIAYNALVVAWPELQRLASAGPRPAAERSLI